MSNGRDGGTSSDLNTKQQKLTIGPQGLVVPPGEGLVRSFTPGRFLTMKLLGVDTADSVMLFEETAPPGTKSWFHLHRDSDEIAYVLSGEVTFLIDGEVTVGSPGACALMPRGVPHAWKCISPETARVLFLYAPAKAGGFIEEQHRTERTLASMTEIERAEMLQRHGWELLGPSPL